VKIFLQNLKIFSKKIRFEAHPLRPVAGRVFFCARPMAKHPSDVAVAWWSRPDEPASRTDLNLSEIIEENKGSENLVVAVVP